VFHDSLEMAEDVGEKGETNGILISIGALRLQMTAGFITPMSGDGCG
jgi:hypothetical protein